MYTWVLHHCRLSGRDGLHDIGLRESHVAAVHPHLEAQGAQELDLEGRLVVPGFVDGHLRLDITGGHAGPCSERWEDCAAEARAPPARGDFAARAAFWIEQAIRHGTVALRTPVELGPEADSEPLRTLAHLRAAYADRITIQIAAYPPPGAEARGLVTAAAKLGADAVGLSPRQSDLSSHHFTEFLAQVRDLGMPLDLSLDEALPSGQIRARDLTLSVLLDQLETAKLERPVRVLHAHALAAVHRDDAAPLLARLAGAGVVLVLCPSLALRFGGRDDQAAARRGLPRLRELTAAGVEVVIASGSIQDPFSPFGTADLLDAVWLAGYASYIGARTSIDTLQSAVTSTAARSLGLSRHGVIEPGAPADLAVLDAKTFADAVLDHAEKLYVFRAGKMLHAAMRTTRHTARISPGREPERLTLAGATLPDRPGQHDVFIEAGAIRVISEAGAASYLGERIEAGGKLVIPAFVDAHLHLDKALVAEDLRFAPSSNLSLAQAIEAMTQAKAQCTFDGILSRGREVLRRGLRHGTTAVRAQCDVDPIIGLMAVTALLELRREFADLVDMQIVAFPQEGLFRSPHVVELMRQALALGVDIVGGGPLDADWRAHIAQVFALAREFGVGVDIHSDLRIDGLRPVEEWEAMLIAMNTKAAGLEGRVAIGHFASSGAVPASLLQPLVLALAEAGVHVAALPASELYRQGMQDPVNGRRGMPRVRELIDAGVNVVFASNNVRDPLVTFGNADMLEQAWLGAHAAHLDDHKGMALALEMVTSRPAAMLGLAHRGRIEAGKQADLVVLDATSIGDALVRRAEKLHVIRKGRVIVSNHVELRGGSSPGGSNVLL